MLDFNTEGGYERGAMAQHATSPGDRIALKREQLGWSQDELARKVGTFQQTIEKIEKGITKRSGYFPKIAQVLEMPMSELDPSLAGPVDVPLTAPQAPVPISLVGERDLPVYGAVEGGDGALVISSEPVAWEMRPPALLGVRDGYAFIIVGDSMFPEFKPGETGQVNPHLPPVPGEPCVFYADDDNGTQKATVKSFIRQTATHWHVEQWNPPKKFSLSRKDWQKCHRVVGKSTRR